MASVVSKTSGIQGSGVFAERDFHAGELLFRFSYKVIRIDHPPGCHCLVCLRCIQVGEFDWLEPEPESLGYDLNHSCEANCGLNGFDIVAMQDIKKGEEVTLEYGTTTVDEAWNMDCLCGRASCRRVIRSVQFLPREIFEQFRGFMPPFVEKIGLESHK